MRRPSHNGTAAWPVPQSLNVRCDGDTHSGLPAPGSLSVASSVCSLWISSIGREEKGGGGMSLHRPRSRTHRAPAVADPAGRRDQGGAGPTWCTTKWLTLSISALCDTFRLKLLPSRRHSRPDWCRPFRADPLLSRSLLLGDAGVTPGDGRRLAPGSTAEASDDGFMRLIFLIAAGGLLLLLPPSSAAKPTCRRCLWSGESGATSSPPNATRFMLGDRFGDRPPSGSPSAERHGDGERHPEAGPRRGGAGQGCIRRQGSQRRPQEWWVRRLEEVAEAVRGGYCRLQMPLKLALGVRETVAGRRLGALLGGGGYPSPVPMHPC